jgi:hypothetical protein
VLAVAPAHGQAPALQASTGRDIYESILRDLGGKASGSVFVVELMPRYLISPSEEDWRFFGSGAEALHLKANALEITAVSPFRLESFPEGTQLMLREQIQDFFRNAPAGTSSKDKWRMFRERFKAQSFEAFSRPLVTEDGLDALIYYSSTYGSLGCETGYAWLHRQSTTAPWVVQRLPKTVC